MEIVKEMRSVLDELLPAVLAGPVPPTTSMQTTCPYLLKDVITHATRL